jgi:hypothetical protein
MGTFYIYEENDFFYFKLLTPNKYLVCKSRAFDNIAGVKNEIEILKKWAGVDILGRDNSNIVELNDKTEYWRMFNKANSDIYSTNLHIKILEFISLINKTFGKYKEMSGGCYKFHLLLKKMFPYAKIWYCNNHVLTQINGRYYDIDGEQKLSNFDYNFLDTFTYEWMNEQFKEYL